MLKTQNETIIAMLRVAGDGGVTPLDALHIAGSMRLASRINEIKRLIGDHEEIVTERVNANGKTFARYVLRRRTTTGAQQQLW